MAKLSKRVVDAAEVGPKTRFLWDGELAGFGLCILPSGKKTYVVQYRAGRRSRRVAIGRHGTLAPDEARRRARELLGRVAAGEDPAAEAKKNRHAPTVAELTGRFLSEHAALRCKPVTVREYRRVIELYINPGLGSLAVKDVTRADVSRLHHRLRETSYQANRTLAVLSKLFNLAEAWGLRPDGSNPCRHIKKYKEEKRERFLSPKELARLGAALKEAERDGTESPAFCAAIRLLVLTGCRLGEIQTLKWSYIKGNTIELPDSKTGAKKVYLGPAALAVLAEIERQPDNDHVIYGRRPGAHLTDLQRPWRRVRQRAGLDDVRIHDLRHSFASMAVASGEGLPMIGKLLGHTQVQTTARYAHLADNPVKAAADKVSDVIAGHMAGPNA